MKSEVNLDKFRLSLIKLSWNWLDSAILLYASLNKVRLG
jgi:hypothetical protein